jgi:Ca-activated chloride channel family protein
MKQFIIIISILLNGSLLFAQDAKSYIHKGNELYQQHKYVDAEEDYRKSVDKKDVTLPVQGNFNLGDALYKQKKYTDAAQHFTDISASSTNPAIAANAYHNLGNSLMETKKYQESVDAYKKSLLNNPKDDQTRYNLAYAQEMLKKQQQKDKQNKNNKNQQNKDQNKQNQDKNNSNKDPNKQNQNKNDQNKDQDKKDQQNQQNPNSLSKEDAQRMLDALNNQEQNTQDKLKNKKLKGTKMHIDKDW